MASGNQDESTKIKHNDGDEGLITVIEAAKELGKQKQHLFKILKRLGIVPIKVRSSAHRGQKVAYITNDDMIRVREFIDQETRYIDSGVLNDSDEQEPTEQGWFYLIQLEPDHDPGRFKVGFTRNMRERMRHLRCSAPLAKNVDEWHCRVLWEKTAIDCITADCEKLHTEVFRTASIKDIQDKCEQFFKLMAPALKK